MQFIASRTNFNKKKIFYYELGKKILFGYLVLDFKRMRLAPLIVNLSNYIRYCEDGVAMAMQSEGWMTQFLFINWIFHFINSLSGKGGIFPKNRHLLIVDSHNSHVTLEVVLKAMEVGLNLLTLSSDTLHCLQPIDVSIFVPFKRAFKRYRGA